MTEKIRIPEISENVTSGSVVKVFVSEGDDIEVDDPVIEFETDKAVVEIPSPFKGRVTKVLARKGDEMKVGDVIAEIDPVDGDARGDGDVEQDAAETEKDAPGKETASAGRDGREPDREARAPAGDADGGSGEPEAEAPDGEEGDDGGERAAQAEDAGGEKTSAEEERDAAGPAPASPTVRRLARELGVDIRDVAAAEGAERITAADVRAHVKRRLSSGGGAGARPTGYGAAEGTALPDFSRWGSVESVELTGVRRLTAENVAASWRAVVHVTQHERADITAVAAFIERNAEKVAAGGGKLTVTAVLMNVCAAALRRFPRFNASLDPDNNRLILKNFVNIGVAVDTPRGLLVPVVRDADRRTITDLAAAVADLAGRARSKKISPDEMEGGTFTLSNQGGIGGTHFTPVVLWPQAAILGAGRASTEPVYVDGRLVPRKVLPLSLSYDHRIVDGADAARFVRWIRASLEDPLHMRLD